PDGVPQYRGVAVKNTYPTTTYPTYKTVVTGVTQDVLTQSLLALRTNILGTVADMIQTTGIRRYSDSRGGGTVTNTTTTSSGSTFDGGTVSNAITAPYYVASDSSATSTFAGNLSVSGNINFNGILLRNGVQFSPGSQWTTSGANIYYTDGSV